MNNTKEIITGLQILQEYTTDEWAIQGEHDVIQFMTNKEIPPEVVENLKNLNWYFYEDGYWEHYC